MNLNKKDKQKKEVRLLKTDAKILQDFKICHSTRKYVSRKMKHRNFSNRT